MSEDDDDIRSLMYVAFEQAFQAQLGHLYKTYIANVYGGASEQAERTKKGIEQAVEAYRLAVSAVDSWEGS